MSVYILKNPTEMEIERVKKLVFFIFFGIVQVILTIRLTKLNKNKAKVSND